MVRGNAFSHHWVHSFGEPDPSHGKSEFDKETKKETKKKKNNSFIKRLMAKLGLKDLEEN